MILDREEESDMLDRAVKTFLLVGGLISISFGLFWAIFSSLQGGIDEKIGDIVVLMIAGTASLAIGLIETIKS
ncbi:MAG: hypothetical protein GWO20_16445, partial [Candidatus Korarchaeota archaeon]|nr:hypothetical protein [Candidatus Korarchaeota archaeon]NIU82393.1 hypothetical protein [Candidatus Thorarchaeota archaeon]